MIKGRLSSRVRKIIQKVKVTGVKRWTLDSRVLPVHCVLRHQNGGLLLSRSPQAHYMWLRIVLQLDRLSSSVAGEEV